MNSEHLELAADMQIDAVLHELAGVGPSRGTVDDTLRALRDAAVTGTSGTATVAQRRRGWLLAAILLLGAGVVGAVAWLQRGAAPPVDVPAAPGEQDPEPKPQPQSQDGADAAVADKIARALRDLELPARRDAALAALRSVPLQASVAALDAAIVDEVTTGRTEVVAALQLARRELLLATAKAKFGLPEGPITIVADYSDNRIEVVDARGRVVWQLDEVFGVWDAELTDRGTLLVTEFSVGRVQEVDRKGKQVWEFEDLKNPYDADLLPNGNVLIADTFGSRVIEVTPAKKVVWSFSTGIRPFDVDRLANGNTLIADVLGDRVLEVTPAGEIAWELKGMNNVHDADRLPDGNTLVTLRSAGKVVEVDAACKIVWEIGGLSSPSDADRLPNGNTLVAENTAVREFDRKGIVVWKKEMTWAVEVARY